MPYQRGRLAAFAAGAVAGAAAEHLLDPDNGRRRRHTIRDQAMAKLRRGSRGAEQELSYMAGKARGAVAEMTPRERDSLELSDPTLTAKVESELFRPGDAPKGSVDVNVEAGVVFLRGEVASRERIEELVQRTEAIDGVAKVEALLHLPGEPARTRADT